MSVSRTPSPMTAGQSYNLTWSSTNATSVSRICTAGGTGYTVSDAPATSGNATGTASAAWVGYPSNCTWKATGAGGTATFNETMTTNAAPVSDVVTYIHTDGLGSPAARTDSAGNLVSRTRYEPYGLTAAGATPTIGFTGHVNDADTGLVYMQQRYYDPIAGRMLSIDPVITDANTGDSFNRYAYVENNPYRYVDPDGRGKLEAILKIVEVIKAGLKTTTKQTAKSGAKEAAKDGEKVAVEAAKRGPKTDPTAPHNAKIRELGDEVEAKGGEVLAGGGRKPEVLIPTPGGVKSGRRPDMISRDANGNVSATQVGRTKADGTPVKREVEALKDLNGPGQLPTNFEGYTH